MLSSTSANACTFMVHGGPAPRDVPYWGSVSMLAQAIDDLYLIIFLYIRVVQYY